MLSLLLVVMLGGWQSKMSRWRHCSQQLSGDDQQLSQCLFRPIQLASLSSDDKMLEMTWWGGIDRFWSGRFEKVQWRRWNQAISDADICGEIKEWRNEGMNEWRNEWINEGMKEWMKEWMNEWMKEWMNEWMNEGMNEGRNEWRKEWMKEWMNEWMERMIAYRVSPMPSSRSFTHAAAVCLSSESLHQPIRQATANELLMTSLLFALIFALAADRMELTWTVFWAAVEENVMRAEICSSRNVDVDIWMR